MMKSNAKWKFKRFQRFYASGTLQPHFIKQIKATYEEGSDGESGVVQSWFDYCEEKYGNVKQPQLMVTSD